MIAITHNNPVAGIYCIESIINKKKYVGSAFIMCRRIRQHFSNLHLNKHYNRHLYSTYVKYGKENLIYYALEELPNANNKTLLEREQYWVDKLNVCNPKFGFNKATDINRCAGYKVSEEGRKCMSEGQIGKRYSIESNKRRAKSLWKSVEQYDKKGNFIKRWPSIKEAMEGTGVERSCISKALSSNPLNKTAGGFIWKYLKINS